MLLHDLVQIVLEVLAVSVNPNTPSWWPVPLERLTNNRAASWGQHLVAVIARAVETPPGYNAAECTTHIQLHPFVVLDLVGSVEVNCHLACHRLRVRPTAKYQKIDPVFLAAEVLECGTCASVQLGIGRRQPKPMFVQQIGKLFTSRVRLSKLKMARH